MYVRSCNEGGVVEKEEKGVKNEGWGALGWFFPILGTVMQYRMCKTNDAKAYTMNLIN